MPIPNSSGGYIYTGWEKLAIFGGNRRLSLKRCEIGQVTIQNIFSLFSYVRQTIAMPTHFFNFAQRGAPKTAGPQAMAQLACALIRPWVKFLQKFPDPNPDPDYHRNLIDRSCRTISIKFHKDLIISFWVILLTEEQANEVTQVKIKPPWRK